MPNRSFLFTPANHPRRVEKALASTADAVILDLEDAVAIAEKVATRDAVVAALGRPRAGRAYVRVNAFDTEWCHGDLCAVVGPGLDGVVLPKLESAAQLVAIDWLLAQLERDCGLPVGSIDLMPIIETGKGVASLGEICAADTRLHRLSFGAGDYTLNMNMQWTRAEDELQHARSAIAVASRAADLEPPVDTVFIHLGELDALRDSTVNVRNLGFQGKLCIHPEQLGIVHEVFTPGAGEVAKARRYIEAFERAERDGLASIQVDGYFIDYPIVEQARRVVELAEAVARTGPGCSGARP